MRKFGVLGALVFALLVAQPVMAARYGDLVVRISHTGDVDVTVYLPAGHYHAWINMRRAVDGPPCNPTQISSTGTFTEKPARIRFGHAINIENVPLAAGASSVLGPYSITGGVSRRLMARIDCHWKLAIRTVS